MVAWTAWKPLPAVGLVALLATCVFNFVVSSTVLCLLDGGCTVGTSTSTNGMYPRMVAAACLVSYAALAYTYPATMPLYEMNVRAHDAYTAAAPAEHRDRALFRSLCAAVYLCVTVPVNTSRLVTMYRQRVDPLVLVFFVFMYTENLGMCLVEMQFATLCRALTVKFAAVNRDLERLGEEIADAAAADARQRGRAVYDNDFYKPPSGGGHSIANAVEVLRIRHRLIRDAVYVLVDLFGVSMAMSLITLCVMAMFDIYYQVFDVMGSGSRPLVYIYMWLLQYSIRFYIIVVTADDATKQALKSKILISDINNRYLDSNAKEELLLFFHQISSSTIEFTACDFFTLNTHLITSAIAAGTTYLVILLQFNSLKD